MHAHALRRYIVWDVRGDSGKSGNVHQSDLVLMEIKRPWLLPLTGGGMILHYESINGLPLEWYTK